MHLISKMLKWFFKKCVLDSMKYSNSECWSFIQGSRYSHTLVVGLKTDKPFMYIIFDPAIPPGGIYLKAIIVDGKNLKHL